MRPFVWIVFVVACGGGHLSPIRSTAGEARGCDDLEGEIYPGFVIESSVHWTCPEFGEGYAPDSKVCGAAIADVQTTCEGTPCTASVRRPDIPTSSYVWYRRIDVVPQRPGPLQIRHEVIHKNGTRELVVKTCAVESPPEVKLTCLMRDSASGAFVACPAVIPAGADLHLAMEATFTSDRTGRANPGIFIIGDRSRPGAAEQIECQSEQKGNAVRSRCTWSARPGTYVAQVRIGGLGTFTELPIVVEGSPGAR